MTGANLDGQLVFVDVDTQRDFLEPTGRLFVPGTEAILANLAKLTDYARTKGIPVIATACAHDENSPELAVFPPHCIIGTPGQERIAATHRADSIILRRGEHWQTGHARQTMHVTVEKDTYDVFERPEACEVFADYATLGATFVVYGVVTDYCVKAAVNGLIDRGYPVALVVDAIRAIVPAEEPRVLTSFAQSGVLLTLTETVIAHT